MRKHSTYSIFQKGTSFLFYSALLGGILLRIIVFFQNRSLFIDEANLARNIAERSIFQLFQQLDYEQYAPPFFSTFLKFFSLLFGNHEWTLRLFPLLCGIGSLFVFSLLIKRLEKEVKIHWFPLAIMAFSLVFVQYSTEVKQYSSDVLVSLVLLFFATDTSFNRLESIQNSVFWSILGMLVVWFSMPSVFFLAAIGSAFFIKAIQKKNNIVSVLLIGFSWLLSFSIYYGLILIDDIGDPNLKGYHSQHFFPMFPNSFEKVDLQWRLIKQLFGSTFGSTVIAIGWGMLSVVIGGICLWKERKLYLWLLSIPILLVLIASSLEYYSLIKRLTLFFLPNLILLSLVGTAFIFKKTPIYGKGLIFLILLLICINQKGYPFFVQKMEMEELRPLLYSISEDEIGDVLYIHHEAVPAFAFYMQHYEKKKDFDFLKTTEIIKADWVRKEKNLHDFLAKNHVSQFSLLFSHSTEKEIERVFKEVERYGDVIREKQTKGTRFISVRQE